MATLSKSWKRRSKSRNRRSFQRRFVLEPLESRILLATDLILSTDGNQSVIQQDFAVALTVQMDGTTPTDVLLDQGNVAGGTSVVYFGQTGTDLSTTVTTAGGATNTAIVPVRGAIIGAFQDDLFLRATVGGSVEASKLTTVIEIVSPFEYLFTHGDLPYKGKGQASSYRHAIQH